MRRHNGFTLSEIIITVGIIAILATMAMPGYSRIMERQYFQQARDLLMAVYSGEQVYATVNDNNFLNNPSTAADWRLLYMDNPNTAGGPVAYSVQAAGGPPRFTARAQRVGGPQNGRTITLNERRVWGGNWTQP